MFNMTKILKAKAEEQIFNIGDQVRFIVNPVTFEKRSIAKWSKTIHTIIEKQGHSYILEHGKKYKYYELQCVKKSENLGQSQNGPKREQLKK